MNDYLTAEQVDQLLRGINPARVSVRDGMSHLEAYDCRAHLNRILGFGRWSCDLLDVAQLYETVGEKSKDGRTWEIVSVGYRATVKLTVCAPDGTVLATYTEAATGDASNFPLTKRADAHDFAIKTAESQAFKRTCINLGDQWGLSLYQKGSRAPLVKRTLVMPEGSKADEAVDHDAPAVVQEQAPAAEPEGTLPASEQASEPPAPATEQPAPAGEPELGASSPDAEVGRLRERVIEAMAMPKKEALTALGRVGIDVSKSRLKNAPTTTPAGVPVSLGMLVDQALQFVSVPKPHGLHDDEADREPVAS